MEFAACPVTNTAPWLNVPADFDVEATSAAGAVVNFASLVTAGDAEDASVTAICTPASGSTFELGETTVNCSVTDSGGLNTSDSFKVNVQDKTAPTFTAFPGNQTLIAADRNGAVLNLASLTMTAADVGGVSEPVSISCDYVAGTVLAIGSETTVSCTATDASQYPSPNTSAASTFKVYVTLDFSSVSFLTPLREVAPFSAHKLNSAIPHKIPAPMYAGNVPATDLADGLRLVVSKTNASDVFDTDTEVDFSAGSTAWRWDADAGHYIYNVKTGKGWSGGTWVTTVSYAGVELASTTFLLRK